MSVDSVTNSLTTALAGAPVVNLRQRRPGEAPAAQSEAEAIALNALRFLASDEQRLSRFLAMTGMAPGDMRSAAEDPVFLGGILDYLLSDESLLLSFTAEEGISPELPAAARRKLPGTMPC